MLRATYEFILIVVAPPAQSDWSAESQFVFSRGMINAIDRPHLPKLMLSRPGFGRVAAYARDGGALSIAVKSAVIPPRPKCSAYHGVVIETDGRIDRVAFKGIAFKDDAALANEIFYLSFVTITSTDYGDIVPVHPLARSLCSIESIIGQLYPATLLARLVTLELRGSTS